MNGLKKAVVGLGLVGLLSSPYLLNKASAENNKFTCENKICKLNGYWTVDDFKQYIENFKGSTFVYWRHKDLGDNEMGDKFWNAMIEVYSKRMDRFVRMDLDEYPEGKKIYSYVELKELPNFDLIVSGEIDLRIRGPPKKGVDIYKDIKENIEPRISKHI